MASGISLSYHKRLFTLLLSCIWVMVFCFIGFQYYREKQFKTEVLNAQLQLNNSHILGALESGIAMEDYVHAIPLPFDDVRITLIGEDGVVTYDSMHSADSMDNHISRPEIQAAMQKGSGYNISRKSASDGNLYFYSATRGDGMIVRTAVPYSSSLRDLLKADWTFVWVIIFISLLISVAGYFSALKLGKTIESVNKFREEENALREEQEKSRLKRQLTNNINHELKTPVASIQVCLETLLSGITLSEDKKQVLIERCYMHNERLRNLLRDVSLITRIEDGTGTIEKEEVVINDLLDEIAYELSVIPEEERMSLKIDFRERVVVNGNQSLIGSIFRNLTENAISYSEGKTIYITLAENTQDSCRIIFEDDGQGVDESKLPRLFERFYRVDKGRSRSKGGTGLGLAIVKHAVLFHGGTISVTNRPQGGLRFDFTLKKQF